MRCCNQVGALVCNVAETCSSPCCLQRLQRIVSLAPKRARNPATQMDPPPAPAAPEANTNTSVYSYSNTWKIRVFVMYSYSWSVQIRIYSYSYVFVDTKVSAKVFVFAQFWGLENPQTYLKPPKPPLLSQNFQKNSKYYL